MRLSQVDHWAGSAEQWIPAEITDNWDLLKDELHKIKAELNYRSIIELN